MLIQKLDGKVNIAVTKFEAVELIRKLASGTISKHVAEVFTMPASDISNAKAHMPAVLRVIVSDEQVIY